MRIDRKNLDIVSNIVLPAFALLLILWNAIGKFYFFTGTIPPASLTTILSDISAYRDTFFRAIMVEAVFVFVQIATQLPENAKKRFARPLYYGSLFMSAALTYPAMYVIYNNWFNFSAVPLPLFDIIAPLLLVLAVDAFSEIVLVNV